jgi:hypothetical protein
MLFTTIMKGASVVAALSAGGPGHALLGVGPVAGLERFGHLRAQALPGADGVGQHEPDQHRDRGDHEAVGERLGAHAAQAAHVADPGHPHDQRRGDEGHHDHQEDAQEQRPHRLGHLGDDPGKPRVAAAYRRVRHEPGHHPNPQADEDPGVERQALGLVGGLVLEVGGELALEAVGAGGRIGHRRPVYFRPGRLFS